MNPERPHAGLRFALALYFTLLIGEGALRKWIFPQYSDILFVIRDPLVLLIYALAWRARLLSWTGGLAAVWVLAFLSLMAAIPAENSLLVTLFGLRTNFLHLPLIYVMAAALDRDDVRRYGRAILWLSLGILALMVVQFNSPRDAFVNAGVGAQDAGQIVGALDRVRPPGPFSFISGVVLFFSLASAVVAAGWLLPKDWPRLLLFAATLACIAAVPVSISRSMLLGLLIIAAFAAVIGLRDFQRLPRLVVLAVIIAFFIFAALDTIYIEAFSTRWNDALAADGGGYRGNIVERMLEEYLQPFRLAASGPLTGNGIGLGTLAGARFATGKNEFLLAESEWSRIVLEIGPILGAAFIGWRVWMAFSLVRRAWQHFRATADALPWMLAGAAFMPMFNGQWGPSTHLGFAVFNAGLCLAALNQPEEQELDEETDEEPAT